MLALVVLAHAGFFFALQRGLQLPVTPVTPKEVIATLIALETAPPSQPQPQPLPEPPKPVPIVKNAAPPKAPAPVSQPAPNAITAPAAVPQPSAPAPAAAAPTAPAAPAQPRTVTGVAYIQQALPEYPAAARRMNEEGTAEFLVLVNEQGRAESMKLQKSSGSPRLDEAARQAILRSLFKPHLENGKATPAYVPVPITFHLE